MRINLPRPAEVVLRYAAAIAVPIVIAQVMPHEPAIPPFFLWIALCAWLFGFGPAVVSSLFSAISLWEIILPQHAYPLRVQLVRVGLFFVAALVVSGVSKRRSTEAREAEERYRDLVELSPDGIVVTDEAGKIIFANSALAQIVGATDPQTLIGGDALDFIHPQERGAAKQRIDQLASGQKTPWVAGRAIKLDGTVIDIERAGIPLRRGNRRLAQGFVRDITEREANRRRLQGLFDAALDAILFYDSSGRYIEASPAAAALLGCSRDEILQKRVGDFSRPEERNLALETLHEALTKGQAAGESTIVRPDAAVRNVEFRSVTNILPGLHVVVMHDITERKAAERDIRELSARLLRAQDEERRRLGKQLHDTTAQDLAAIQLNLGRMNRLSPADPKLAEPLRETMTLTEQVIAGVRTLSYQLHPPLIDEAGLVPALSWYASGFEARSAIKVRLDAPENLCLPRDVETALFRIVQEALTNIQRHSGSAVARISIRYEAPEIRLTVSDEGHGISANLQSNREALFASGVGMAGIRERVRELGGALRIESTDRGTEIIVTLRLEQG